eukprot:1619274-Amphidinium_carterae.4
MDGTPGQDKEQRSAQRKPPIRLQSVATVAHVQAAKRILFQATNVKEQDLAEKPAKTGFIEATWVKLQEVRKARKMNLMKALLLVVRRMEEQLIRA